MDGLQITYKVPHRIALNSHDLVNKDTYLGNLSRNNLLKNVYHNWYSDALGIQFGSRRYNFTLHPFKFTLCSGDTVSCF